MGKVWFITGASQGFGRLWAAAALERGDSVVATTRRPERLADLLERHTAHLEVLELDLTDRDAICEAVRVGHDRFGRLDVVVNNAGYGHFGMVEEVTEAEARSQMDTNFFGPLWVTQAVLPLLRAQGGGRLIQVSSIGGVTAFANLGMYDASKWALEGLSQALAKEVAAFGIKVTIVEPGGFATEAAGASARHSAPNSAYDELRAATSISAEQGDPAGTVAAILHLVDHEEPPLRVFLGSTPFDVTMRDYDSRIAEWRQWLPLSKAAQKLASTY